MTHIRTGWPLWAVLFSLLIAACATVPEATDNQRAMVREAEVGPGESLVYFFWSGRGGLARTTVSLDGKKWGRVGGYYYLAAKVPAGNHTISVNLTVPKPDGDLGERESFWSGSMAEEFEGGRAYYYELKKPVIGPYTIAEVDPEDGRDQVAEYYMSADNRLAGTLSASLRKDHDVAESAPEAEAISLPGPQSPPPAETADNQPPPPVTFDAPPPPGDAAASELPPSPVTFDAPPTPGEAAASELPPSPVTFDAPPPPAARVYAAGGSEPRNALVIGNGAYQGRPLNTPPNDAMALGRRLNALGFDVDILVNANLADMREALYAFSSKIKRGGVGLFYFGGYGLQYEGENFLVPVGADVRAEYDIPHQTLSAYYVLDVMADARNRLNVIALDACRRNPYPGLVHGSPVGLAKMSAPTGSLLVYAAAPQTASVASNGRHGLFAAGLIDALGRPGLELSELFKQVRIDVVEASGGQQVPWESSSVTGDFYFYPAAAD